MSRTQAEGLSDRDLRSSVVATSASVGATRLPRTIEDMDSIGTQTIVVGIDGSATSDAALDWAVTEAVRRSRRLHLFSAGTRQVIGGEPMYSDWQNDAALTRDALEAADTHLGAATARARKAAPGLVLTAESVVDSAAGGLVDLSSEADTIVLGRSGHGQLVGAILGSVALQVAAHAHCPVVVVDGPKGDDAEAGAGAREVVVGVDGSAVSELALGYAFEQATWRGVPLRVVHAWWTTATNRLTPDYKNEMINQERLTLSESMVGWSEKYPDVEVRTSLPIGTPVLSLVEAAKNAELLVVGSRGRGGFRGLLLGSVSQAVLHNASCTVAVVHPPSGGAD